jgi:hypothetical protein
MNKQQRVTKLAQEARTLADQFAEAGSQDFGLTDEQAEDFEARAWALINALATLA